MADCTLSSNLASGDGSGGGIYNAGPATLTNCTLSGNSAGVGGGIFNVGGAATLENTIIAKSPRSGNGSTLLQSNGHNLDDDGGCGFVNTGDLSLVPANLAPT